MKRSRCGVVLLLPFLLAGCGGSSMRTAVEIIETIRQGRDGGKVASLAPDPQAVKQILALAPDSLPPVEIATGGVSVAVFEPQTAASPSDKAFGNGCGRWLQLHVAGLPGLAGSPTWYGWDYAQREQGIENGAPSQQQAFRAGKALAVSHIATGKLEGTGAKQTLVYRLWKLPELKPLGAPLEVKGSRQEIAAALPRVARTLAQRLGVPGESLPARTELDSGQLSELGKLVRLPQTALQESQLNLVRKLAPRSPLAGMVAVTHFAIASNKIDGEHTHQTLRAAAANLARQAGQNCLVLAHVSAYDAAQLKAAPHWQALAARYPRNYALAYSRASWSRSNKDRNEQRQAVLAMLAAAPQSAWAWLGWDELLGNEAEDVRQSRSVTRMSREELDYVGERYPQMVQTCLKALQCDPLNAYAWLRLSRAAAFNSQKELADNAYRQALSLPSHGRAEYQWGLQLYQPKWQGDRGKLRRVAQLIYQEPALFVREYVGVVQAMQGARMFSDARRYEDLAGQALAQWLENFPRDSIVRANYASLLDYKEDLEAAARQSRLLIEQHPDSEAGYVGLGKYYDKQDNWAEAAKYYEMALQRDPEEGLALFRGGQAWHQMGKYDKAEVHYRKAIALYPKYADPYNRLADLHFFVKNDRAEAERLYRKAIELDPSVELFHQNLQQCLAAGR